jgi:hypothetical protein
MFLWNSLAMHGKVIAHRFFRIAIAGGGFKTLM